MIIGIEVDYRGLAAVLSYQFGRNLWKGTAPFGRAMRQSYGESAKYWYDEILPEHFEPRAKQKYNYQQRRKPYLKIKRRLARGYPSRGRGGQRIRGRHARVIKGGMVDIVRSGQTERVATRGVYTIVAGTKEARLTFNVPFYITQRSRSGRPRMAEELKRVTSDDIQRINKVAGKAFFTKLREEGRKARARKFKVPAR